MEFATLTNELVTRYQNNLRKIDDGHWVLEIDTRDSRSQIVHVLHRRKTMGGEDASRVVADSPIGPLPQRFDLERLLRKNAELEIGAICIEDYRNDENELETYITLRASRRLRTMDLPEIWEIIEKVAFAADDLELEIYARDLH